jgi:hypothetical protein
MNAFNITQSLSEKLANFTNGLMKIRGYLQNRNTLFIFGTPTGKSVGSTFVTYLEPADLPAGVQMQNDTFLVKY